MKRMTAEFIKGVVGPDKVFEDGIPQIAFIGRSNVGKSSIINSLTNQKSLARTSSFPGRTQEINVFLINGRFYLLDLSGYGFSKHSLEKKRQLHRLIDWYLFQSPYRQKQVVLIIDAEIGPTEGDLEMLRALEETRKNIVIVANKIDKINKSKIQARLKNIRDIVGNHKIIPYSSVKKIGMKELAEEIFGGS